MFGQSSNKQCCSLPFDSTSLTRLISRLFSSNTDKLLHFGPSSSFLDIVKTFLSTGCWSRTSLLKWRCATTAFLFEACVEWKAIFSTFPADCHKLCWMMSWVYCCCIFNCRSSSCFLIFAAMVALRFTSIAAFLFLKSARMLLTSFPAFFSSCSWWALVFACSQSSHSDFMFLANMIYALAVIVLMFGFELIVWFRLPKDTFCCFFFFFAFFLRFILFPPF